MFAKLWTLLHLFTAFSFVGSLLVAEWCARSTRASLTQSAPAGQEPTGDAASLGQWRLSNVILSALYVALLIVMVYGPRS